MASVPTTVPDLGPQHLVVNGVYIFNEFSALLAYMWTGVGLKTDRDEYLGSKIGYYEQLELGYALDPLLRAYGDIKNHCIVFRDGPFQTIGDLNGDICAYADKVGYFGTGLYAGILANIRLLRAEKAKDPNSALASSLQTTITNDIDNLVNSIMRIKDSTDGIITLLDTFETQCATDALALQHFHEAAVQLPTGPRENWTTDAVGEYNARITVFGPILIDTDGIVEKIQAAIRAIQLLIGSLDVLSHELASFQHYMERDVPTLANAFSALVENNLSHQWSAIKSSATAFKASIGRPL
ncbi:hypothetical protein C8R47DRAFT_1171211 [Mycena vitilis]|nr:hypothetical protein C8R47DRAFT_1171211 [Mycena vitilis]